MLLQSRRFQNRFIQKVIASKSSGPGSSSPWREDPSNALVVMADDAASKTVKNTEDQENQDAYDFLHRSPHRHDDLGGYGEDMGYHYPPRAFIDPDFPHIAPYYNRWHQCANLRESRYSHHRRMLKSLDIAKLVRHGRLLPLPHKLLNDYLMSKIPLKDADCSAFFDYAHSILIKAQGSRGEEENYFPHIQDMFERLLATKLPPSDVGARTHAAMIRCCAQLQKFHEGYDWFRERARTINLTHTVELYDAIIELCEKCNEKKKAWLEFDRLLSSKMRVPPITLCRMLRIAASEKNYKRGKEVWELFDFFQHQKNGNIYAAGLEWLSECPGTGREALSMVTEMQHLAERRHAEQVLEKRGTDRFADEATYDRFSARIIHNNIGPYSSGISLYCPESQSYSNNQSIHEYEADCYMRTLQPNIDMVLHVLYSLIRSDGEAYKLAWDFFCTNLLRQESHSTGHKTTSCPSAFVTYETVTYMFYGAYLHRNVEVSMKLFDAVHSNPKLRGLNIMPQAVFYWLASIRGAFEQKCITKPCLAPNSKSKDTDLLKKVAKFQRLQSIYSSSERAIEGGELLKKIEHALTAQYETTVLENIQTGTKDVQRAITDSVLSSEKTQRSLDRDLLDGRKLLADHVLIGLPDCMESIVTGTLRNNPRSVYEEWIYTEYIGALANYPWASTLGGLPNRSSYLSGFRKIMSLMKHFASRSSPINTRIVAYALDVVLGHAMALLVQAERLLADKGVKNVYKELRMRSSDVERCLFEIFDIIQFHRSGEHFVSCDTIRYRVYRIWSFLRAVDGLSTPISNASTRESVNQRVQKRWESLVKCSKNSFEHELSPSKGPAPTNSKSSKKLIKQKSDEAEKSPSDEWNEYQRSLWGEDPECPRPPRQSDKVKINLNFSREDRSLAKFGQKIHSPKIQTSF